MNITLQIKNSLESLSKTEFKIASFILDNTEHVKTLTSSQLADEIGVGQSTIIKFVKKFGFKGFTDFKIQLSESLVKEITTSTKNIHDNISIEDPINFIYSKLVDESIKSIQSTFSNMNYSDLEYIIELLNKSNRIFLLGIGGSCLVAKDFNNKLLKIGKPSLFSEDLHVNISMIPSLTDKDVCVVFSYSGKTKEIVKMAEAIKEKNCPIVGITSNINSPLAKLSHKILSTLSDEGLLRSSAMSSRMAQLSIVDILFLGLVQKNYDNSIIQIQQGRDFVGWKK